MDQHRSVNCLRYKTNIKQNKKLKKKVCRLCFVLVEGLNPKLIYCYNSYKMNQLFRNLGKIL